MSKCCDPKAPKIFMLGVGGDLIGLVGIEQAFSDIRNLGLENEKAAEKLLEIVMRRNYVPEGFEHEYKLALHTQYKKYLAKIKK